MLDHGSHLFSQHQQQRLRTHQHLLLQQPISRRLNTNPRSNNNHNHSPSNLNPRSSHSKPSSNNLSSNNLSRTSSSSSNNSSSLNLNLSRSLSLSFNLNHNLRPRPPLKRSPSLSNGHSSQLCSFARENWCGIRTEIHGVSAS